MSFVKMPERTQSNSGQVGKKKLYFRWIPGVHKVRFLDEEGVGFAYVHWVNGAYVKCLGDNCPICQENFRIIKEAKEAGTDYRKNKNFRPRTERYYANVLDLTPVKVCPNCGAEIHKREDGTWPDACSECGKLVATVEPKESRKVKILSKGRTLFSQFNSFEEIYGEPPTKYNVALIVKNSREVSASAIPNENEPVEYNKEDLYNLPDEAVLELTAEELVQLSNGVRVRDILVARNSGKKHTKIDDDTQKALESLFND